ARDRAVQLCRPRVARARVPRRRVVRLCRARHGRHVPRLLLPLPARPAHGAHGGAARLRRRRQLVGHADRVRAGLLHEALRGAPGVARGGVPVLAAVLLEPRGPSVAQEMNTPWITTGPAVGSSSVAWLTPLGVMTSIAFGTVPGSTEQMGETPL